jgi:hypothetical protein
MNNMYIDRILLVTSVFFAVVPSLAEAAHVILMYDSRKPQILPGPSRKRFHSYIHRPGPRLGP